MLNRNSLIDRDEYMLRGCDRLMLLHIGIQ